MGLLNLGNPKLKMKVRFRAFNELEALISGADGIKEFPSIPRDLASRIHSSNLNAHAVISQITAVLARFDLKRMPDDQAIRLFREVIPRVIDKIYVDYPDVGAEVRAFWITSLNPS